ncbi:MAG: hypothetical protein KGZ50_02605 [Peptococcaceae bacterium]|nr:hypothetical protein [Peptococcaceae bacterium]
MKKWIAKVFVFCFTLLNLLPLTVLAAEDNVAPDKPYEKIAAKSGRWYAEPLAHKGKTNLVVGYTGSWKSSGIAQISFEIKEKIVLSGVYLPLAGTAEGEVVLHLVDAVGNSYKGFTVEKQKSGGIRESGQPGSSEIRTTCIFIPNGDIALPKGQYTLSVGGLENLTGAFLVKGFHFGAYEKYRQSLLAWELENNPTKGTDIKTEKSFGREELSKNTKAEYEYGESEVARPPVFALDAKYQIDEIIVSTFNDGKGASPGKISIISANGRTVFVGQSYGVSIENVANGAWKIAPAMLLPAGNYSIALTQPKVLSYDQAGEPLFYVKVSLPVQLREDFTGIYRTNLDLFRISTLMGKVEEKSSSFSLKDFELTVLDKGTELELIGQYEGLPFSQRCEIVEETAEKIVARFDFAADLTRLPYKAKLSAKATVTLVKVAGGAMKISMNGTGGYDRAASAEKGADRNTYNLKAAGIMAQREIPPFVMTALGKVGGVGRIPGPDNTAQAAAGILFPPLAGLVVSVLQEALKPKVPAKSVVRDKNWYKEKYPGKTDEQLAMIMLGDAMGNTDNPDEGDAVSVGDNEYSASSTEPSAGNESGSDSEEDAEPAWETKEDQGSEPETGSDSEQREEKPAMEAEQSEQEPETLVVQTSASGAQTLYVKDPKTGEWVDPQTNSVLDIEKHGAALEQMKKEQDWSNKEFGKISAGESEHDKALRDSMAKISQKKDKEDYKDLLKSKYGTDNLAEISILVNERQKQAAEWAEIWHRNDKIMGVMEIGAVAVGAAADVGIDGLALITPGGSKISAGYKVLKGVAGTMAEAGAKGKDAVTLANFAEGLIKGGADAALDKIPSGTGRLGGVMNTIAKASLTTAGQATGSGVGAGLRGEDVGEAVTKGLKDGAYKAAVGAVTDKLAGNLPNPVMSRGSFKAVPNLKNVIVSKAGATKIGAALVDEFGVKPVVLGG